MSMNAGCVLGDDGDLLCGDGIDDAEAGVALIHDQQRLSIRGTSNTESRDEKTQRVRLSHGSTIADWLSRSAPISKGRYSRSLTPPSVPFRMTTLCKERTSRRSSL